MKNHVVLLSCVALTGGLIVGCANDNGRGGTIGPGHTSDTSNPNMDRSNAPGTAASGGMTDQNMNGGTGDTQSDPGHYHPMTDSQSHPVPANQDTPVQGRQDAQPPVQQGGGSPQGGQP